MAESWNQCKSNSMVLRPTDGAKGALAVNLQQGQEKQGRVLERAVCRELGHLLSFPVNEKNQGR